MLCEMKHQCVALAACKGGSHCSHRWNYDCTKVKHIIIIIIIISKGFGEKYKENEKYGVETTLAGR